MLSHITPFRIGLVLVFIGAVWIFAVFSQTNKAGEDLTLEISQSVRIPLKLTGEGIGFYYISSNSYQNDLTVKVIDQHGNYLDIRKITNKITVNYFRFEHTNQVTLEITNLSKEPVNVSASIGDTRIQENSVAAISIFLGACILLFSGYRKLRDYATAHPDENS